MPATRKRLLQVCGDPTVDWMVIKPRQQQAGAAFFWQDIGTTSLSPQPGGAALTTALLQRLFARQRSVTVQGVVLDEREHLSSPRGNNVVNSVTLWEAYGRSADAPCLRINEFVTNDHARFDHARLRWQARPQWLVIEDTDLGWRQARRAWPPVLQEHADGSSVKHVLAKLANFSHRPRGSALLRRLCENGLAQRTTVIVALNDLRACSVRIGGSLCWESMFDDVIAALHDPEAPFADSGGRLAFQRVLVTLEASGAILADQNGEHVLCFDRYRQEGDWEGSREGHMMGYNTCMVAALAHACIAAPEAPDWAAALPKGLTACRRLHDGGYELRRERGDEFLCFPYAMVVGTLTGQVPAEEFATVRITEQDRGDGWTLLSHALPGKGINEEDRIFRRARDIVLHGPEAALGEVPLETVRRWLSADAREIAGLRRIRNAVTSYLDEATHSTPLSLAVFGPPGAGKSFAIKELASSFAGIFEPLTFNVSQFQSPMEVVQAFHQIRDVALRGQMPLVFWDEFDSRLGDQPLGWLRYFLAPMHDGEFLDGGVTYHTGPGVYIFVGATSESFAAFSAAAARVEDLAREKSAKKPDFISRLKGCLDVMGPNPNPDCVRDRHYPIRRAFYLLSLLRRLAPVFFRGDEVRIQDGVLNAFLKVSRYRHGTRSMQAIVETSYRKGKGGFELSSLPPLGQLDLHVSADEFMELTRLGDRQILKIGITGHRFLAEQEKLRRGIASALRAIERRCPRCFLSIFSMLAEGADRLVAQVIRETKGEGTRLIAVLPLPKDDYITDFDPWPEEYPTAKAEADAAYHSAELKREFEYLLGQARDIVEMPTPASRNQAYEQGGFFIADNCDVLIAVWDGEGEQGQGGTGAVVRHAKERGIPVCHVWAGNRKPGTNQPTSLGKQQGKLTPYNF